MSSLSCIEFFDPYIVFKQEHSVVKLIDVISEQNIDAAGTEEFDPKSFVFLPGNSIMAMYDDKIEVRKHSLELIN